MIRVENLTFQYDDRTVLEGVSLSISKGEIVAVVGMSGCGKTTLLRCIGTLIRPLSGRIWLDDEEVTHLSEGKLASIRRRIGMVFQYSALLDSLTVFENVALGLRYNTKFGESMISDIVAEKLTLVGMSDTQEYYPAELSGGMQKRVALARALAASPDILLYDEPTAGLDPIMAGVISDLIVNMKGRLGVTSVLVSHDIHSVLQLADRVGMLHEGTLRGLSPPEEFARGEDPVIRQFVEGQAEGPVKV